MSGLDNRLWTRRGVLRMAGGVALASASVLLTACGGSSSNSSTVEMSDKMTFIPNRLTIRVGTSVSWRNTSDFIHTATADPRKVQNPALVTLPSAAAPWDSGTLSRGQTWEHRFDIAGTYRYVCVPHELGGMVGTIIVEG